VVLRHQVRQQTSIIRNNEQRFRYLAEHDALTGVFVRTVLLERLEAEMKKAAQNATSFAMFMIDVDGFKQLNDTMGHAAGDEILVALSRRIQGSVREADTVARMGGDEFIALLPGVHGTQEAERIASQVLGAIYVPFAVRETEVSVSVSIGVTVYPGGGKDSTSLLHSADVACTVQRPWAAIAINCIAMLRRSFLRIPNSGLTTTLFEGVASPSDL